MKRFTILFVLTFILAAPLSLCHAAPKKEQTTAEGKGEHPKIEQAVKGLEDVIQYLENAPDYFGGHKDNAITACNNALKELKAALKYRAQKEEKQKSTK